MKLTDLKPNVFLLERLMVTEKILFLFLFVLQSLYTAISDLVFVLVNLRFSEACGEVDYNF